ncbi:SDR family NAD(P)-dependent oxidoreductase [Lentzea sp. PSKA42]|uniref:SDR family NAD(P)-dependent oxidoreductase n=1 Tax=Lentzea indica TaxID=2604800 RepID=A0ABX1FJJ2_9PSEU|nr:SDR family NAD(P)-dependent oxidoreductase [Lentzea indica]NKE58992.1 SDR family NAD(P)-dependent oxidoreductase [Lentzea indica]
MPKPPRRKIDGSTVVISGAASGIGRALAQRLSAHGCPVAITDIDQDGLKETEATLLGPVLTRVLDVSDAAAQAAFAIEVKSWMPSHLGAVFNNAGVATAGTVLDMPAEDHDWLMSINLGGVVHGTRAFLPILVDQGRGTIVNTSSVYGLGGVPHHTAYCASKFAVRGFTDALRQELRGTGVDAVNIHPGGIRTNIARNGRFHQDPEGLGRTQEDFAKEFDAMAMTTPDKAAKIIHRGLAAGKSRILVGPDAYVFDAVTRLAPTHYFTVVSKIERLLQSRT